MFEKITIEHKTITAETDVSSFSTDSDFITFVQQLLDKNVSAIEFTTSGTTGTPSVMRFTKEQIAASALRTCAFFNLSEKDTALLAMPLKYVAGRMILARAAVSGMNVQLGEISLNPLRNISINHSITFIAITPAQALHLIENEREKLNRIATIIIGGGEIPISLEEKLLSLNGKVYATYAMTETLSHVAVRKIGEPNYVALPDVHFSINENNCLQVHVPYLYKEPLQTKDVVKLIDTTTFEWLGRFDLVINSGGIKIYPENIERKIAQLPFLQNNRFYVSYQKDSQFGQIPVLFIETNTAPSDFLSEVNALLEKYEKIKAVYFESQFEETATGKIKRKTM